MADSDGKGRLAYAQLESFNIALECSSDGDSGGTQYIILRHDYNNIYKTHEAVTV